MARGVVPFWEKWQREDEIRRGNGAWEEACSLSRDQAHILLVTQGCRRTGCAWSHERDPCMSVSSDRRQTLG